ncbi:biotin synthase BioB [Sphingobium scionense]|uniref:Biotin synthase n=1 Tax=Sphingobium scionense TaxID=1404341 RepID=A0A7W6PTK8_9SPHN|nr:biotin synthase BioB [Sphingobium scionense]MBB4147445.1 biotin synthase [Sphingobium scionense]
MNTPCTLTARNDWTREEIAALFDLPFGDLMFEAQSIHRANFPRNEVQLSTLLSIKTGGCPEDCGYCNQSASAESGLKAEKLMSVQAVMQAAAQAKDAGSSRFCMGAAWRNPKDRDMPAIVEMVKGVRQMGMETCMTLGMLDEKQAKTLADAGLDYYNHNIDTSPEHYEKVITTRTFDDRLVTLENVRNSGINVCSGGIVGMGEAREDRVGFLHALAVLPVHPQSVPINALVPVKGTVLGNMLADTPLAKIDEIEFVRTVAVARIVMPESMVRLSAGRESMSDSCQALCFMAGANSIFTGDKLLTTANAGDNADAALFAKLGVVPMQAEVKVELEAAE